MRCTPGLLLGTIAALAYTVMTAMPTAVSWDEIDAVDNHWGGSGKQAWQAFSNPDETAFGKPLILLFPLCVTLSPDPFTTCSLSPASHPRTLFSK